MDQKHLTLEAMSVIFNMFLNEEDEPIPSEIKHRLLLVYSHLQHIRDDSSFLKISVDLSDQLLRDQRKVRLSELRNNPFNLEIDQAISYEEAAAKDLGDANCDSIGLGRNISSDNIAS